MFRLNRYGSMSGRLSALVERRHVRYGWVMQPQSPEQDLIAQAQRGDEQAVTSLYEMHVDAIFEYISYRVGSRNIAEDLTSDVFVRMVRGLAQYKERGLPFRAWLFRIAGNLI